MTTRENRLGRFYAAVSLLALLLVLAGFLSGCAQAWADAADVPVELRAELGAKPTVSIDRADDELVGTVELGTVEVEVPRTEVDPFPGGSESGATWRLRLAAYERWGFDWDLIVYERDGDSAPNVFFLRYFQGPESFRGRVLRREESEVNERAVE